MTISSKGRYALHMLIDLAEHPDGFVSLSEISARQNISKKYLEQIVPLLNKADILLANRGHQGGYRLKDAPETYTLGKILRLTEGGLAPVTCLREGECNRTTECASFPVWQGLERVINEYLDSVTLKDLLDQNEK